MLHNVLRHLEGIEHYGVLSLCLFVLVFAGILVWACLQKKRHLDHMARLPLDGEPADPNGGKDSQ